ncbi:hypothetical protein SK128_017921, partial [Halocaridina rubra]
MVYEECSVGEVVRVYPDLGSGRGGEGRGGSRRPASKVVVATPSPPTSSSPSVCFFNTTPPTPSPSPPDLLKINNMTIVSQPTP